jgi:hypothetical protein
MWCDDRVRETGSGESFLSFSSRLSGKRTEKKLEKNLVSCTGARRRRL